MKQRLTKDWLKVSKRKLSNDIRELFTLSEPELLALVQSYAPGMKITEATREDLLRQAIAWKLEEVLPDSLWF